MEIVFIVFVFDIIAGMVAAAKGRNPIGWFFLCLLFTPLLLIVLLVLPSLDAKQGKIVLEDGREV